VPYVIKGGEKLSGIGHKLGFCDGPIVTEMPTGKQSFPQDPKCWNIFYQNNPSLRANKIGPNDLLEAGGILQIPYTLTSVDANVCIIAQKFDIA
jgi:hypothetical protein